MTSRDGRSAKKHHYVPQQALLSRFAVAGGKLFVLDKRTGDIRTSKTKEVAHENYFYRYRDDEGTTSCIEEVLAPLDGDAASLFRGICAREEIHSVSPAEWETIEWFVIVQWLRSPRGKGLLSQTAVALRNLPVAAPPGSDQSCAAHTTQEQSACTAFESIRHRPQVFARLLSDKVKMLLKPSAQEAMFYSSDHPMVLRNAHGDQGLVCPGIEVYLPLSPSLILSFFCPQLAATVACSQTPFRTAQRAGLPLEISSECVEALNELQVRWSSRFIYSASSSFDTALRLLENEPALRNPPQPRVTVL